MAVRTRPTSWGIAIIFALTAGLSSCTSSQPKQETRSSSTPTESQPASSTTTPPTASSEDTAVSLTKGLIPRYYQVADEAIQDPVKADAELFKDVAISSALTDLQNLLTASKEQGLHQVGGTTLVSIENPRVDLTLNATKNQIPTVQWDVCYDVSKLNVVDKDGKSVVPANRPPRALVLIGVSNYKYPAKEGWRVSFTKVQEGKKC